MLAMIAGAALFAVGSVSVGETPKEATTARRGVSLTLPPGSNQLWEDSQSVPKAPIHQPSALFPDRVAGAYTEGGFETSAGDGRNREPQGVESPSITYSLPEHDALTAYVYDPGFTLPMPAPPPSALVQAAGALSEGEAVALLTEAGWPVELHAEALAVACGIGNSSGFTSGESGCRPGAVGDGGNSLGFFQLWYGWARYCGIPIDALLDALENARCAYRVYLYDIEKGYGAWKQWTVKP